MQSPKPSTRTVAQRKVYGKRRNHAARAVFDQKSPARQPPPRPCQDATVDSIESKLASITIHEEPAPLKQQAVETSAQSESFDESPSPIAPQNPIEIPTETPIEAPFEIPPERPAADTQPRGPTNYEKMVEVRICTKPAPPASADITNEESIQSSAKNTTRKKSPAVRRSSGCVHDVKANTYVRPILNEALSPIASQAIQKFSTWASRSANMFHVAKLAEGSYGEVYKLHLHEESKRPAVSKSKLAKLRAYGDGVFKVVPLRAQSGPGSKKFTSIEEIVSEVKMLKYLDPIPGFARFREIHVVQGRFPTSFQSAWDHYKKTKDDCLNPNPSSKKAYPDSQLWAIVEMDDAGCELEKFRWSSVFQIYDIFWGVAMALARAEEYALFEVKFSYDALRRHNVLIMFTASGPSPGERLHSLHPPRWLHGVPVRP